MSQQDKRGFSADALAALAAGGPPPLAAQDAPAYAPPTPPADPAAPADPFAALTAAPAAQAAPAPADPFAALAAAPAPAQAPQAPAPIPGFTAAPLSAEAKKARSAQLQKRAAQQHGHTFRQVAIPLLLVVGAILWVMATIILLKLPAEPLEGPEATLLDSPLAPWLILAAYLVGAVLFLGAFLFHMEVKQAKLKQLRAKNREAQAQNGLR